MTTAENTQHPLKAEHQQQILQRIVLLGILVLVYLSYHGVFSWIWDTTINQHILAVGDLYLNTAQEEALETFGVISLIKTGLAVMQSSSGGISFFIDIQVQLGELFNVFSEVINRAWQISWFSLICIESLKFLVEFSRFSLTAVLTLSFILLGAGYGLSLFSSFESVIRTRRASRGFYYLSKWGFFLFLVIHLVIPLSIFTASSSSSLLFQDKKQAIHQEFLTLKEQLEGNPSDNDLHSQVKATINAFKSKQESVRQQTNQVATLVIRHAIYSLAEHLFFPILLMILLSVMVHRLIHHHLGLFDQPEQS